MNAMNDDDRRLLGLPTIEALTERFLEAVKNSEAGVSVREMAKRNKDAPLIDWMRAGAAQEGVRHEWSPVKGDPASVQESRYFLIAPDEA